MTEAHTDRLNAALSGRYRIDRKLGEGGMATVYLADDLRHARKVALKVLKPELAAVVGAERFLAEIRTTASLQHSHILPLFDSGEADKLLFYVMPHVEGESLRARLQREHQLPVDEASRIASDVAEALDYAHRRGVVHRDIKPANILLQDGKPVISDFGIALAVSAGGSGRLTETGLSLGTPHYMSPEQATGDQTVGPATDIWALGCVLYEMLVGEPPYTGSTPQAVLGKILTAAPASAIEERKSVPANVDAAIRRALEKLPADRFTRASAFARALADASFRHGAEYVVAAADPALRRWKRRAIGFASIAALFAVTTIWSATSSRAPAPQVPARFDVTPSGDQRMIAGVVGVDFALSRDGSRVVYIGPAPGGGTQLWLRALDQLEAVPIARTEDALAPALSPDGQEVAFLASSGAIRTVALDGGPPVTVGTAGVINPAWGSDGMIYFVRNEVIYRVPATGGEPEAVTTRTNAGTQMYPDVLPDGRGLLVTMFAGTVAETRIGVVGPEGGEPREILAGTTARYAASGHVIYATAEGTLMAAPFDLRRLDVTGPGVALVEGVLVKSGSAAQFALSESGTLVYETGAGGLTEVVWVSREGRVEPVDPTWTGNIGDPALSPDATRLAVTIQDLSRDVWVKQLDRGPSARLTAEGSRNDYPSWTPDGTSVTYFSDRAGPSWDLWTRRADGSAPAVLQLDEERSLSGAQWSPNGEWLVYRTAAGAPGGGDILALRPGRDAESLALFATRFAERGPTLSPDGRWMAYVSSETGRHEIYVVPFPSVAAERRLISTSGGTEPIWSPAGGEIFYRNGQGDMVAVRLETEPTLALGSTTVLFAASEYLANYYHRQYDVAPDGQRFIMIRPVGGVAQSRVILVQNFLDELRMRVEG